MPKAVDLLTGEVVEVRFFTSQLVPLPDPEKQDPRSQTVQTYLDTQAQVEELLAAGERLSARRQAAYDSDLVESEEALDELEVPLSRGADRVEVEAAAAPVVARLEAARKKLAADDEAKQKAAFDQAVEEEVKRRLASDSGKPGVSAAAGGEK